MIKTIVFDLGNVLFDFCPLKAARSLVKMGGIKRSPKAIVQFFADSPIETAYCEGKVSTDTFIAHVKQTLNLRVDDAKLKHWYCDIFSIKKDSFRLVKELKKRNYRLLILSNTNDLHYEFLLTMTDQLSLFDDRILSYEVFCQKPQKDIYDIVIERAQCQPDEIFFIDDLIENIESAHSHGIVAHHFSKVSRLRKALHKEGVL